MKHELLKVTEDVMAIVLNLGVRSPEAPSAFGFELDCISASVEIHGAWDGAVVLSISESLAKQAAAIMLDLPLEAVDEQACFDATGELANIVGGNIKALLPDDTALSPPQTGKDLGRRLHAGASELAKVELEAAGEPIRVVVYGRLPLDGAG